MSAANDQPTADILDSAIEQLRRVPVSNALPERLVAETLAALHFHTTTLDSVRLQSRRQRMFRIARYSKLAAAVLLLSVGAGVFWLTNQSASSVFGQTIEHVKKATSVSFSSKQKFGSQPVIEMNYSIAGDFMRMEMPGKQESFDAKIPLVVVVLANTQKKEVVEVNYSNKTARKFKLESEVASQFVNPIEGFSKLTEKDAERIGEEEVQGKKTVVYRLQQISFAFGSGKIKEGESAKVWADATTGLPVRIVLETFAADRKSQQSIELDNFIWNQPIAPKAFEVEIPEGFTVSDKPSWDLSEGGK
jgi:outer membrane lipoprotein-sorting protein